jgi:hypothetical protein
VISAQDLVALLASRPVSTVPLGQVESSIAPWIKKKKCFPKAMRMTDFQEPLAIVVQSLTPFRRLKLRRPLFSRTAKQQMVVCLETDILSFDTTGATRIWQLFERNYNFAPRIIDHLWSDDSVEQNLWVAFAEIVWRGARAVAWTKDTVRSVWIPVAKSIFSHFDIFVQAERLHQIELLTVLSPTPGRHSLTGGHQWNAIIADKTLVSALRRWALMIQGTPIAQKILDSTPVQ